MRARVVPMGVRIAVGFTNRNDPAQAPPWSPSGSAAPLRGWLARSGRSRRPPNRAPRASAHQGGVAVLGRMLATMSDGRATSANEYPTVPPPAERLTGRALGIDIGGTSIKAAVVDVVRRLEATGKLTARMPGGAGFPSVIRAGRAMTATQLDRSWIGAPVQEMLGLRLRRPMVVLNDADAAGVGEMALGAGQGQPGVVLLLALGTGIGSALLIDGQLVPNIQVGHVGFHSRDAESRLWGAARTRRKMGWKKWGGEFNELLARYETYLWPDLIILGGGLARKFPKYQRFLKTNAPLVAAAMGNTAGIVGAARVGANAARGP